MGLGSVMWSPACCPACPNACGNPWDLESGRDLSTAFTAFGPSAIESRIGRSGGSGAKIVIIDAANRAKLEEVPSCPPVIVLAKGQPVRGSDFEFCRRARSTNARFRTCHAARGRSFMLIFTSDRNGGKCL